MKICFIQPVCFLEKDNNIKNQYSKYGTREMALTHLCLEETFKKDFYRERYISYMRERSNKGTYLILDNSAFEIGKLDSTNATGEGLGPELVLKAAELIKPSLVVAQDILLKKDETIDATKEFVKYCKAKNKLKDFELMGVCQGSTKEEWLTCYEELLKIDEIKVIGFSKISIPICFLGNQQQSGAITKSRLICTEIVNKTFKNPKRAHLLGGDNYLGFELKNQKKYSWVESNDSSACVWYGMKKRKMNMEGKFEEWSANESEIIIEKPDLELNKKFTIMEMTNNYDIIVHNCLTLLGLAN